MRTPSSDAELRALGQFQGRIGRNSNFRSQALNHNLGRNVRVIKLLTALRLLRLAGRQFSGTVTCTGADKQNFSSNQGMTILGLPVGSVQAAHFLPGTIRIGDVPVWDCIENSKFRGHVEFLFGDVEHLPMIFNQADTSAERKHGSGGLCAALVSACQFVLSDPAGMKGDPMPVAWCRWTEGARIGLRTAIADKAEKGVLPPLMKDSEGNLTPESIEARGSADSSTVNREDVIRILGYYLQDQEQRDWNWAAGAGKSAAAEIRAAFRP